MKSILSMVIIFCFFSVFATDESIVINEICVRPEKKEYPKWIELRSLSKDPVNLKGWSLHDMTGEFYKFSKDLVLNPNQLLLLLFYAGDKPSSEFEKEIPKNAKRINVLSSSPLGSLGEFYIKTEACEKYSKTFNFWGIGVTPIFLCY